MVALRARTALPLPMLPNALPLRAGGWLCGTRAIAESLAAELLFAAGPFCAGAMFWRTLPRNCSLSRGVDRARRRDERVVLPDRPAVDVGDIHRIEVVAVDERVVHDHRVAAPCGMPAPSTPTSPTAAEEAADTIADTKAKAKSAHDDRTRRPIPVRIGIPNRARPRSRQGRKPARRSRRGSPG